MKRDGDDREQHGSTSSRGRRSTRAIRSRSSSAASRSTLPPLLIMQGALDDNVLPAAAGEVRRDLPRGRRRLPADTCSRTASTSGSPSPGRRPTARTRWSRRSSRASCGHDRDEHATSAARPRERHRRARHRRLRLTVSEAGVPHVVHAEVVKDGDRLLAMVGAHTADNARRQPRPCRCSTCHGSPATTV